MEAFDKTISVVGGGAWGTALAQLLASEGRDVTLLLRDAELAAAINTGRENSRYLPGISLHPGIRAQLWPVPESAPLAFGAEENGAATLARTRLLLLCVPCQALRGTLRALAGLLPPDCVLVNTAKGIEVAEGVTGEAIVRAELPDHAARYAMLSGPSFAREVADMKPTAVVLGCRDEALGAKLRKVFAASWFRSYSSVDVSGVELGGAIKNIIAIAAGLSDGLGFGLNARAALVTRGLAETSRLGTALGARAATFMGLSGLGDLLLTTSGDLSRNRQVGLRLGAGEALPSILASMRAVAEGVRTCDAVQALAEAHGVDMPVTSTMHAVLHQRLAAREALQTLMGRSLREE